MLRRRDPDIGERAFPRPADHRSPAVCEGVTSGDRSMPSGAGRTSVVADRAAAEQDSGAGAECRSVADGRLGTRSALGTARAAPIQSGERVAQSLQHRPYRRAQYGRHDLDASVYAVPEAYSLAFRTWYRVMIPKVGRRARRVITISEFSRGELHRYAGIHPEKTTVVPGSGEHVLRCLPDGSVLTRLRLGSRPFVLAVSSQS